MYGFPYADVSIILAANQMVYGLNVSHMFTATSLNPKFFASVWNETTTVHVSFLASSQCIRIACVHLYHSTSWLNCCRSIEVYTYWPSTGMYLNWLLCLSIAIYPECLLGCLIAVFPYWASFFYIQTYLSFYRNVPRLCVCLFIAVFLISLYFHICSVSILYMRIIFL